MGQARIDLPQFALNRGSFIEVILGEAEAEDHRQTIRVKRSSEPKGSEFWLQQAACSQFPLNFCIMRKIALSDTVLYF